MKKASLTRRHFLLTEACLNKDVKNVFSKITLIACIEIGVLNRDVKPIAKSF